MFKSEGCPYETEATSVVFMSFVMPDCPPRKMAQPRRKVLPTAAHVGCSVVAAACPHERPGIGAYEPQTMGQSKD